jgi:hypothetical protein
MRLPIYATELAAQAAKAAAAAKTEGAKAAEAPPKIRCMTKLVRNYRSHSALLELPSRLSYDGAATLSGSARWT